jgi:Protein of unknown function DUF262
MMATPTTLGDTLITSAVDERRKRAETKALDISLNELADMYSSEELIIHPEYQRLFRWSKEKQSQFIESLLLEMPIPPIFVIEIDEGKWELIDGLQRLSTYLHFRGELNAPELGSPIRRGDKLVLEECDIVKELNGLTYDDLPLALQIRLKRNFLRVETVRKGTDNRFRYYMFKRLNTGGEQLSEQEVRNCTIRLLGEEFNSFIIKLAKNEAFRECIEPLSEESRRMMGDIELVLRFFAFKNNFDEFKHDVADFMTNFMERVTFSAHEKPFPFDYIKEQKLFEKTFALLKMTLGPNTCQRWLGRQYGGQFLMHHFEAISLGIAKNLGEIDLNDSKQVHRIKTTLASIKRDDLFKHLTTGGGQNSPGPYRRKIEFVAEKVRGTL